ncbi:MAG: hypothetical protein KGL35_24395 [Bradyrhizobium sp.]|nr:hypothetical protein [Bradyrhizobium sp.]
MRKTVDVTIGEDGGRDAGKVFVITEMPAIPAERWAMRAVIAMSKAGVQIPDDIASSGMVAIAAVGFQALMNVDFNEVEPLLNEMMSCVQIRPDALHPEVVRKVIPDDFEEVRTILKIRGEVLKIHTDFSTAGSPSK